jgi:glucuronoarabinoxylan endo-1,4-beta-xylanase
MLGNGLGVGLKSSTNRLLVTLLLCLPLSATGQNLISNGGFESGYNSGWNHQAGNGASAAYSAETTDPYEGSIALKVVVDTLGSNAWDVQTLGPSLILSTGEVYTLTFHAKAASAGSSFRVLFQNSLYRSATYNVSTNWAQYSWNFTAEETNPQYKMQYFELGTFWVDDIQLTADVINTNPVDLTISTDLHHQEMVGFGGALTWYSSWVYHGGQTNADVVNSLIFEDAGLDVLRLKNWYYPTNYPAGTAPVGMDSQESFDTNQDYYDAAKAANTNIQVLLSSWSPPASLKSNNVRTNGGTLKMGTGGYMYDELAQYWVDAFDNMGWSPDYLSFQNEPGYVASWDSCILRPTETTNNAGYAEAADAIWNAIKDRPDAPKLIGSEAENIGTATWSDWNGGASVNTFEALNTPLLSRSYFAAHGYHIYNLGGVSQIDGINNQLNMIKNSFGDRPNWMTEYSSSSMNWLEAAQVIHNTVVEANAAAYIYWTLVWETSSPSAMIGIEWDGTYRVGDHFYTLKHYAKYVDKGYHRIDVAGSNNDIKASGYLSPKGTNMTLVVINKSTTNKVVNLLHNSLPVQSTTAFQSVTSNFYQPLGSIDIDTPQDLPPESLTTYSVQFSRTVNRVNTNMVYLYDAVATNGVVSMKTPDQAGIQFSLWESRDLLSDTWTKVPSSTQQVIQGSVVFTAPEPPTSNHFYQIRAVGY